MFYCVGDVVVFCVIYYGIVVGYCIVGWVILGGLMLDLCGVFFEVYVEGDVYCVVGELVYLYVVEVVIFVIDVWFFG